jgi:hypothetical protein
MNIVTLQYKPLRICPLNLTNTKSALKYYILHKIIIIIIITTTTTTTWSQDS